ncbi:MAG: DNA-binding transcriptional ArsR family regulator [Planctomycetota bacterium]|jgi:DNA-binding transcriptional ArsR family regulator
MSDEICPPVEIDQLLSAPLFKSLSDPVRLQIVARLLCARHPQTVTEVTSCCGVHLSGVSRHLQALKGA